MAFRLSGIRLRKMDYGTRVDGSWLHMVKEVRATGYPWCSTFPIFQHFASLTMGDGSRSRNTDLKTSFKILNDGKPASIQLLLGTLFYTPLLLIIILVIELQTFLSSSPKIMKRSKESGIR